MAGGSVAVNSYLDREATPGTEVTKAQKTAPGEGAEDYFFDAEDPDKSWKDRTYIQGEKTFIQSKDKQRMYEVPMQKEVDFTVGEDGTITLNDDIVSQLDGRDYRDFVKAYASLNLVTQVDPVSQVEIDPKPITIKSNGARVIITQTGINDVAKKIRGAGIKSQDNVSSILLLNYIIENAQMEKPAGNKHGKSTPFTDYRARFSVGGRTYDILLNIKNAKQGDRYHYHALNKVEVTPVDGSNGTNAGTYQTGITSDTIILPQSGDGVKSQFAKEGAEYTDKPEMEDFPRVNDPLVREIHRLFGKGKAREEGDD